MEMGFFGHLVVQIQPDNDLQVDQGGIQARSGDEVIALQAGDRASAHSDSRQEQQAFGWVNGKDPRQYGLSGDGATIYG